MTEDRSSGSVPPHVLNYLRECQTLTLATISSAGEPHAAILFYVNDGPTLYAWTRIESTTARNVAHNPAVAFTIDATVPEWSKTQGIQGSGTGGVLRTPDEIARAVVRLRRKFPAMGGEPGADLRFLELTATELWFIDLETPETELGSEGRSGRQMLGQTFRRVLAYNTVRDQVEQESAPAASSLTTIRVPAGAVVVQQGTPADSFYIVVDGVVAVLREEAGHSRQVGTLRRGQFFGEIALLRDLPRTATVQALVPTTLLALDRAAFRDLVAQSLGTTTDLDRIIQRRLDELMSDA